MRPLGRLTMLGAACVVAGGFGQAPASAAASCARPHSKTLASNSIVRVYEVATAENDPPDFVSYRIYACLRSRHRTRLIGNQRHYQSDSGGQQYDRFRLAGRFLAYEYRYFEASAVGTKVRVRDLRTGRLTTDLEAYHSDRLYTSSVDALLMAPNGVVGWIAEANAGITLPRQVWKGSGSSGQLLDEGKSIERRSLSLRGTTLSWRNAGAVKTAAFP